MSVETKKGTKTKTSSPKKTKEKELCKLEQEALNNWRKRYKERVGPLKFKKIKYKTVTHVEEAPEKFWPKMMETAGSTDVDFYRILISQTSASLPLEDSEEQANFVASLMHGLRPRDETEGVLIAQMAGTHNLIMEYMKRALIPEQYLEAANDYTNRAYKLMNIFLRQLEALEKDRDKTTQQKVIVEHVHIHEGGQAVVGHIESKPRVEGDEHEK